MIGWLDPSIDSSNTGDQIIAQAVREELVTTGTEFVRLPTRRYFTRSERRMAVACSRFVVGGTNLLNGNYPFYRQWILDPEVIRIARGRTSCLGVGWWQYQRKTNLLSRTIWSQLFGGSLNSCRDQYTETKLAELGVPSINTACVTMWRLPNLLNTRKLASKVVLTLTDYNRNFESDYTMLRYALDRYDRVVVWPQGADDADYCTRMRLAGLDIGDGSLTWFDSVLDSGEFDYIGTRLHAGIRAHQRGANSLIVAVDNRASEISQDTNLAVIDRADIVMQPHRLEMPRNVSLELPGEAIDRWRGHFMSQLQDSLATRP